VEIKRKGIGKMSAAIACGPKKNDQRKCTAIGFIVFFN